MKDRLGGVCKRYYKDLIAVIVMFIAVTLFLIHYYEINKQDFNIPFRYTGTDEICTLVEAKMVQETGWNVYTDRLAAPYGFDNANNIISGLHNADTFTTIFTAITGSYVATYRHCGTYYSFNFPFY